MTNRLGGPYRSSGTPHSILIPNPLPEQDLVALERHWRAQNHSMANLLRDIESILALGTLKFSDAVLWRQCLEGQSLLIIVREQIETLFRERRVLAKRLSSVLQSYADSKENDRDAPLGEARIARGELDRVRGTLLRLEPSFQEYPFSGITPALATALPALRTFLTEWGVPIPRISSSLLP